MKFVSAHTMWVVVLLLVVVVVPVARGIWLDLPSSGTKCVSEELHGNVVVLADYYAFISEQVDMNSTVVPTISAKVTSPYGNDLHHVENVTHGQFAFTTTDVGNYLACFWVHGDYHGGKSVVVGIDWKTGIATKDWDAIAKKENLHGLELELKKLEEVVEIVRGNLIYLKNKDAAMRAMNELTNSRVAWYSITSLGVCIMVSIFQILYLRHYFQKKKLI